MMKVYDLENIPTRCVFTTAVEHCVIDIIFD